MSALRVALNALERDPGDAPSCARVQGVFASQIASGARFAIIGTRGERLCGEVDLPVLDAFIGDVAIAARIIPNRGLALTIWGDQKRASAVAFFPVSMLADLARPDGFLPAYAATLSRGPNRLVLQQLSNSRPLDRTETASAGVSVDRLSLDMRVRSSPITSPLLVAMLLPLLMWAAAASIGWFVVDRLLIRPLRRLRDAVGAYQPGEVLKPIAYGAIPAIEIQALDDTFRGISRTVQFHEADLAAGLVRQTRLTREVHHRVKNNLQVIASLINLHARSAPEPAASDAYASIQRRVDALAVVHRHHYAELEENRGLELRSVIGELASNLRATAPPPADRTAILLDLEPLTVSQDVAVAIAFLITELVELSLIGAPHAQITITARSDPDTDHQAVLNVQSGGFVDSAEFQSSLANRYGRVITGLSRQLRAPLDHDPLTGSYEIRISARRAE